MQDTITNNIFKSFSLSLSDGNPCALPKPCVMGVINMSPNSFFRPFANVASALVEVEKMVAAGASIIDIGGEATNPFVDINKEKPAVQLELDRVLPLIEAVSQRFDVIISVDTSRPQVMRHAVATGAQLINDQRALWMEGAVEAIAELKVPVCLMHFFTHQRAHGSCSYAELLQQVKDDLLARVAVCEQHGIARDKIMLDPGFGGGNYHKSSAENFYLLAHLVELVTLGFPLLVGWSRKSMIGEALGNVPASQRLSASIAAATVAALKGASILRVHDVQETMDAVKIIQLTVEE